MCVRACAGERDFASPDCSPVAQTVARKSGMERGRVKDKKVTAQDRARYPSRMPMLTITISPSCPPSLAPPAAFHQGARHGALFFDAFYYKHKRSLPISPCVPCPHHASVCSRTCFWSRARPRARLVPPPPHRRARAAAGARSRASALSCSRRMERASVAAAARSSFACYSTTLTTLSPPTIK